MSRLACSIISLGLVTSGLFVLVASSPAAEEEKARPTQERGALVDQWQASGKQGAVVAGGPEAVECGLRILENGGNAADAAAATLLALSVTDANQFCFGGEVPILAYSAQRDVVEVIAGQGAAPQLATRSYFEERGGIPASGIEAATVPATLDACLTLLRDHGTLRFGDVVAPTLGILDRHEHSWHEALAKTLRRLVAAERASDDRRRGLRLVADYFYRGPIAEELDAWFQEQGGLIRYQDLATHVTHVEEPVSTAYRSTEIIKCGPWTQGPYLLETLQLLEGFEVAAMEPRGAEEVHLVTEALKLGLADRDVYYADPLYEQVPLASLLDPAYAERRRTLIDPEHASQVLQPGDPLRLEALGQATTIPEALVPASQDTTTCIVADAEGNVVAATPSGWSGTLCPSLGIWFGSRLQSFNLWKGHPNCLEPGKRPRITLTPTLVLRNGQPVAAISVAGGDLQDQVTLQLLLSIIDHGQAPAEAVQGLRYSTDHHIGSFRQAPPELASLTVHDEASPELIAELKRRGHQVKTTKSPIGHPTAVTFDRTDGVIRAAGDPRRGRHAGAF